MTVENVVKKSVIKVGDVYFFVDGALVEEVEQAIESLILESQYEIKNHKNIRENYTFFEVLKELIKKHCEFPAIDYNSFDDWHHYFIIFEDGTWQRGD